MFCFNVLFNNHSVLTTSLTTVFCVNLYRLLECQATATSRKALVPSSFEFSIPSQAGVVTTITSALTFQSETKTYNIAIKCEDSTFGLVIAVDETSNRAFINQISTKKSCSVVKHIKTHKAACKHLKGFYVVAINDGPYF